MYNNLNSAETSYTILSVLVKVAVVYRYSTSCVENAFSARNRVDTVSRTSLSLYKEGILTVLHFKRELTMSVHFPTSSSSGDKNSENSEDLKCNIYCFLKLLFSILSCKSGIISAALMIELDPYYSLLYILYNLLYTFISN